MSSVGEDKIKEITKNPWSEDKELTKFIESKDTQLIKSEDKELAKSIDELRKLRREEAREKIANKLIWLVGILYCAFLSLGSFLLYNGRIEFRDLLDLVLVLGAISGFLGAAINFYFKE